MKRTSLSVILALSMLGAPMPVQAANGMTDMMSLMMEMFLWMMRSGSGGGSGFNPYSMGGLGGYGNPMMANSMFGNPQWGSAIAGYPQGFGNMSPYGAQGLYSPLANSAMTPFYNPYTTNPNTVNPYSSNPYFGQYVAPYNSTYYGNNSTLGYGYQPYYRQAYTNPFYPYRYNLNSRDSNIDKGKLNRQPGEYNNYNNYGPADHAKGQTAPVVIQPIIVSPVAQPTTPQNGASEPYQYPAIVNPPVTPPAPVNAEPVTADDYVYSDQSTGNDNSLYGKWQGINGEYMELGSSQFHLRSGETDLQGTYQLKNSILKAEIPNRAEPVYMQYHLTDGYLMFLSEDGQKMLFRRLP